VNLVGGSAMALAGILAVVSVVVRFRRSEGEERLQLRWLAWACVLILLSAVAVVVTGIGVGYRQTTPANDAAFFALVTSVLIGFPLATAMAVLRYRLYDLDIVVKKTAIYSIVAIVLTALYLALLGVAALAGLGRSLPRSCSSSASRRCGAAHGSSPTGSCTGSGPPRSKCCRSSRNGSARRTRSTTSCRG
jgi:hypothetical protein